MVKVYSAIDLLDKVLEFIEMTPNPSEWNLKALKPNLPRQIRFRQIEALLNAFFIGESNHGVLTRVRGIFSQDEKVSIAYLLEGQFLKARQIDEYTDLIQFIKEFVEKIDGVIDRSKEIKIEQLTFIFPKLIDFKKRTRNLLTFNSGWLDVSSLTSLFSVYLTNSISDKLTGNYKELDFVIGLLISPQNLIFTETELIEKFNFPTENLNEVDSDFI